MVRHEHNRPRRRHGFERALVVCHVKREQPDRRVEEALAGQPSGLLRLVQPPQTTLSADEFDRAYERLLDDRLVRARIREMNACRGIGDRSG